MTAETLLSHLTQFGFVAIFVVVLVRALRSPRRSHLNAAFFFGALALLVAISWSAEALGSEPNALFQDISAALLLTLPYALLRLADDFTGVRTWIRYSAAGALTASIAITFAFEEPAPHLANLVLLAYFLSTTVYASLRFFRAALTARGVAAIRMRAVASGSAMLVLLMVTFILSGIEVAGLDTFAPSASSLAALAAGLCYFAGFAPPGFAKRAWQAPELSQFLRMIATTSPALEDTGQAFREIEAAVAQVMGTPRALILLHDQEQDRLVAPSTGEASPDRLDEDTTIAALAFRTGQAVFSEDPARDDPDHADLYRDTGSHAILVAPLAIADERFGLVAVFGERPPFFAEDDLELLCTIADQIAVLVRDRTLLQEASRVRTHQETMRLKDDFLSAAAHDLKTPLTVILGESQMMLRRASQQEDPAEAEALTRVVAQAQRMRRLIVDLLDASSAEQNGFVRDLVDVDLLQLAQQVVSEYAASHDIQVAGETLVLSADRERIRQVLVNLLENAIKYSPGGARIRVDLRAEQDAAVLSISDSGVGIPHQDMKIIFERFQRGSRDGDYRFSGMGVGLYLSRRIVEDHGGTISVTSHEGQGSTFEVRLPASVSGRAPTTPEAPPAH